MKKFSDLRELAGRKPKGEVVSNETLRVRGNKIKVQIRKDMGKFTVYIDGDVLDAYRTQKEAEKASKTFEVASGIIGLNSIEIFAICSSAMCKILFIFSILFSLSFHGSSSFIYLFVKKLILITDFI